MNKQTIKDKIIQHESYGLPCDEQVKVINLRCGKKKAVADIVIYGEDGLNRYNNCEYPYSNFINML